jgi:hypothetical protein
VAVKKWRPDEARPADGRGGYGQMCDDPGVEMTLRFEIFPSDLDLDFRGYAAASAQAS